MAGSRRYNNLGWMDRSVDGWMDGWVGWMEGMIDGWIKEVQQPPWLDEWIGRWSDGWIGG